MSVLIMRPNSDISTACLTFGSGTGHYDRINEVTADDTNGICTASIFIARDRFGFPTAGVSGTIIGVTAKVRAWGGGGGKLQIGLRVGSTNYRKAEVTHSESAAVYSGAWNVNPQTSAAWTWESINALQLEIGIYGAALGSSEKAPVSIIAYCSQAWLEVEYEAPPSANKVPLHLFFQGVR